MYFYHKIIVIEPIVEKLHQMDLSEIERYHLSSLVDSSLHHAILDEIMSHLSDEDKRVFMKMISEDPEGDQLLEFLNEKVDNIEEKIKRVADDLVAEMHQDILEAEKIK